jgi:hypothetical protein
VTPIRTAGPPRAFEAGAMLELVAMLAPTQLPLDAHVWPGAQHCPPNVAGQEVEDAPQTDAGQGVEAAPQTVTVTPGIVTVVVLVVELMPR